jgi:A/G-specific adenine glycosylase
MAGITEILIDWYRHNKRDLPWRSSSDPYHIWLSEIILQQTRVSQGLAYYYRFIETFPDVKTLAEAAEEEVLKVWQGLGYYSRARNLHHTARVVVNERNGEFPADYQGLLELKGIGEYTAAAIASIAYNEVVPVIDGNVARVLSRLFGLHEAVNSSSGIKTMKSISQKLISSLYPADYNQAIMEFGALFCKPSNPDCPECPLKHHCVAYQKGEVSFLPVKKVKQSARDHYIYYLALTYIADKEEHILIHKRVGKGIWKNLYDFPALESSSPMELDEVLKKAELSHTLPESNYLVNSVSPQYSHQLTHMNIRAVFIHIILTDTFFGIDNCQWINKKAIVDFPVSRLIEKWNYLWP